jgi:hypothetical protein
MYRLGNDGLKALIPYLEYEYLLNIKRLDFSYNNLNDAGLEPLVHSLASLSSPIEEFNISGNNLSDGIVKIICDYIKNGKLKHLSNVIIEDCPKVSEDGRRILRIA